ncbi:hypothetical protein CRE_17314 [Caenorhabditis remanei]|uniref:Uncharacterized protein n=1 Tax=Caenorhabditis remanei TaxID=31234 RepID=E3MS40_CAERE|nr:hypothetical protein CRE_17314 [Caenorhabditis remanei]
MSQPQKVSCEAIKDMERNGQFEIEGVYIFCRDAPEFLLYLCSDCLSYCNTRIYEGVEKFCEGDSGSPACDWPPEPTTTTTTTRKKKEDWDKNYEEVKNWEESEEIQESNVN